MICIVDSWADSASCTEFWVFWGKLNFSNRQIHTVCLIHVYLTLYSTIWIKKTMMSMVIGEKFSKKNVLMPHIVKSESLSAPKFYNFTFLSDCMLKGLCIIVWRYNVDSQKITKQIKTNSSFYTGHTKAINESPGNLLPTQLIQWIGWTRTM